MELSVQRIQSSIVCCVQTEARFVNSQKFWHVGVGVGVGRVVVNDGHWILENSVNNSIELVKKHWSIIAVPVWNIHKLSSNMLITLLRHSLKKNSIIPGSHTLQVKFCEGIITSPIQLESSLPYIENL